MNQPSSTSSASVLLVHGRARAAPSGEALMVAGGLLLGTVGVFVEESGQDALMAVWFRCTFGALALLAWGACSGRLGELRLRGRALLAAAGAGLLMILNWGLFFAAIRQTSISLATVVFHVQPLWVLAAAAWWGGERVTRAQLGAVLAALTGLALATGLADGSLLALNREQLWGLLLCLGGSLSYAGVTLIAKAAPGLSPYALACWQCFVGTAVLLAWPLTQGWPAAGPAWAWLAGLGAIHTGFAYVILYAGMARLVASRIAVLQFVYPAAALGVDWLVYGRALGPLQLVGVALMGLALWSLRRPAADGAAG